MISGTPSASGAASFTVQATDSLGNIGSRALPINIGTNSLTVNPASLPAGTQGAGLQPDRDRDRRHRALYVCDCSGALPAGLSLNTTTGLISGTPTGSGASSFTVRAIDALGNAGARDLCGEHRHRVADGQSGDAGRTMVRQAVQPDSHRDRRHRALHVLGVVGRAAAGLTLNAATGVISGTPTAPGVSSFTIQALDASATSAAAATR